jgi:hypothetical protein
MAKTSVKSLPSTLDQAYVAHAKRLTSALRRRALGSGWPTRVSRQLTVTYTGEAYKITYPDMVRDEVVDLEYGTTSDLPHPLMRQFVAGIDKLSAPLAKDIVKIFKNTRLS